MKYITTINDQQFEIEIRPDGSLWVNGEQRRIDFLPLGEASLYSIIADNLSMEALVEERDGKWEILLRGRLYMGTVLDERAQLLAARRSTAMDDSGEISIRAPMPGLVVAVPVEEGQEVEAGQTVVILESMKMENELKVPRKGVVQRISCEVGQSVEQNKLLVTVI
ncbi:MAG: biotin/lipoyl-binding protein [Chloroflexi bacterium]|nr:MAG: acetyl-CoA carboxylase biotin carboxyl carrier protein subunit [Phototrophicales bacterium]RMF80884.1 MAG: biotin/lipoyl-binding protein [Chloroflexota bacterium]